MTGRERLLAALENQKPDRLPCQVHSWMQYYLKTYLKDMDQYQAYKNFDMDPVIYINPNFIYNERQLADWVEDYRVIGHDGDGNSFFSITVTTPKGILTSKGAYNQYTGWITEYLIKDEKDFEFWNKYRPIPEKIDWTPVLEAKKHIGDSGIVRSSFFDFGPASPWQSFTGDMYGMEKGIMAVFDNPEWVSHVLDSILDMKLKIIDRAGQFELDLVETGGGAGSSTVISPDMHKKYCLPYDRVLHKAFHEAGTKVVYHLCGGLMPLLETVAQNGADGLETMTPPEMGGDCNLKNATDMVGDKLFFIGGFDQNAGFETGNPELVKEMVYRLHSACPDGGYICSPSDHFFFGNPENIKAFAEATRECTY